MSAIDRILQSYRDAAVTEREKGTYFERLALAFFKNDPVQAEEYVKVWTWAEWAKVSERDGKDIGIDLGSGFITSR
jgi:predicted helicase